ncbi:MAG: LysM peptidoglycan-binding domain-containing protein [Anaerolineales bacterium]|nr:LysM peptidoglycan-binding domain-containing protein [Anaerolineales bacterium]
MNLTELLKFLPLIIGVFLAYHLIVRQSLPSKKLGEMLTYFIGIIIVFIVISWLITSFLAGWATDLLQAGTTSTEWQEFMSESENVVDDAFNAGGGGTPGQPTAQPTAVQVFVVTATPIPGESTLTVPPGGARTGPTQYTVIAGDTLIKIAQTYGVTPEDIRVANGLVGDLIQVGQVLIIPAPTQ